MALDITIQHASDCPGVPADSLLESWLNAACLDKGDNPEVCLRIVDRDEITALNRDYRGKNQPTNVLSFPADLPEELALPLLGDIVICAGVIADEAAEQGKPLDAHWAHMCIHGMLHLQGYDHQQEQQAIEMETLETDILAGLGYASPYDNPCDTGTQGS
ncbi:MAG TPA: rRNA maturation RNase YbeY [Pseudomonadales bacterium]